MDDSFQGMFKLIGSNYSVWKSKIRNMLVCNYLWLPLHIRSKMLDKIDASTWEVLHLKAVGYIMCFIDMSLYNNFDDDNNVDVLWEKIDTMFGNNNVVNFI